MDKDKRKPKQNVDEKSKDKHHKHKDNSHNRNHGHHDCDNRHFVNQVSFYGNSAVYDGGNRDDINRPVKIDATGRGLWISPNVYQLETRTGFASPEAQAYIRGGILPIAPVMKPISNTIGIQSVIPVQTPGGIVYQDINSISSSTKPLVYTNENPNIPLMYQGTGYIPVSNIPVITKGTPISSYLTPMFNYPMN